MKKGFTLIETLVAVGIFVAISIIIWGFGRNIFFLNSDLNSSLNVQFGGRTVLRRMVEQLRNASPSSLGAYPLALTSTSSLTFYSNIDSDVYKEEIRYFIQGNQLKRGVTKPSGSPLTYNPSNEVIDTVIDSVANPPTIPIFDYFDQNYAGTSSPMSVPINTLAVRLIRINLVLESDPNRPPPPITVTTQVMLRNLKDNL